VKNKRIDLHGHIFAKDFSNVRKGNRSYDHFILREDVRLVAANNSASEGFDSLDIPYQVVLVGHPFGGQGQVDRYYDDNVLRYICHDDANQNHDRVDSIVAYCHGNEEELNVQKDSPARDHFHKAMNFSGKKCRLN